VRPAENDRGCFGVWVAFRDSPSFKPLTFSAGPTSPLPPSWGDLAQPGNSLRLTGSSATRITRRGELSARRPERASHGDTPCRHNAVEVAAQSGLGNQRSGFAHVR
jgi:hypothetical protein